MMLALAAASTLPPSLTQLLTRPSELVIPESKPGLVILKGKCWLEKWLKICIWLDSLYTKKSTKIGSFHMENGILSHFLSQFQAKNFLSESTPGLVTKLII